MIRILSILAMSLNKETNCFGSRIQSKEYENHKLNVWYTELLLLCIRKIYYFIYRTNRSLNIQKLGKILHTQALRLDILSKISIYPFLLNKACSRLFVQLRLSSLQSFRHLLLVLRYLSLPIILGLQLVLVNFCLSIFALNSSPTDTFGDTKQSR